MAQDRNRQKKIAVISDFTGFGRCSLTVAIPLISHMRIQCCGVPTVILSNHTGYDSWYLHDYTDYFQEYTSEWKRLGLHFQGILTGFLGSEEQFAHVEDFIRDFDRKDTIVCVDPVMGDDGVVYGSYTDAMCERMKDLVAHADLITPNLTEACILTDTAYHDGAWKEAELKQLGNALLALGPKKVVITGITQGSFTSNLVCEAGKEMTFVRRKRVGGARAGAGDAFASMVIADAVNGVDFTESVKKASAFIQMCIRRAEELDIHPQDGLPFEEMLGRLK